MLPQLYKCFQHWSANGSIYIYSDPHFEDSDCKTIDTAWPAPAEQIKIINSKVHKTDTLIILGDIGNSEWIKQIQAGYKVLIAGNHDAGLTNYKKTITHEIREIVVEYTTEEQYEKDIIIMRKSFYKYLCKKYPYAKISIQERYEFHSPFHFFDATIDDNLFDEVYGGPLFIGEKILLSHEPIDIPFALNIHGHTHSRVGYGFYDLNHFNVCSNTVGFEPQNLSEIIKAGFLKRVETIHRLTIDKASENPIHGHGKAAPKEV